jgi:hypothetical protein
MPGKPTQIENLITLPGPRKAVRLVRDSTGRTIGAVVSEVSKFGNGRLWRARGGSARALISITEKGRRSP